VAITEERPAGTDVVYELVGTLLEACNCGVLCPCWIGEDPDAGTCDAFVAYHFDEGTIRGIDVSGLNMVGVAKIPGNVLAGNWRVVYYLDERATDEQMQAILDAYGGKLGGPLADLAGLIGEVVDVQRAPITHEIEGGRGVLRVGDFIESAMEPYRGPDGETTTTLRDSVFSTVPGSPAYVAKAEYNRVRLPQYGMEWAHEGRNAIQADYRMSHTAG
jgi:hypothetical protein